MTVSAAFEGSEELAKARDLAGLFLTDVQAVAVQVSVWDTGTAVPAVLAPDPSRIGQHGLETVMAVCQSFAVRREPAGKRITATVTPADDPGGDAVGHQPM
ncbi:ATP-binding protein [Streptomyces sp. NPDC048304]|uniref:ATP-binding protein n=1 Tax=Streptomyces sp. NPDC048304 TaxID=3154820 RepID=UPI0033E44C1A